MHYYYDDEGQGDHWKDLGDLESEEEAIKVFDRLFEKYKVRPAILYDENFKTVKEERDCKRFVRIV